MMSVSLVPGISGKLSFDDSVFLLCFEDDMQ